MGARRSYRRGLNSLIPAKQSPGFTSVSYTHLEEAVKDVEAQVKGEDKAAIDKAVERLMAAAQKVGEKLNKAAAAQAQPQAGQAAGAAGGEAPKGGNDDDVVDADFKEVKH